MKEEPRNPAAILESASATVQPTTRKLSLHKPTVVAIALGALLLASEARAEEKKVNLGVSIPAATHGWTAGIIYWANQAKKDLEQEHPGLKVTVKTAGNPAEQANQLQDLLTVTKIDTLVILPFESAPLTKPVAQLKSKGVYVTVVDRGLTHLLQLPSLAFCESRFWSGFPGHKRVRNLKM